jgi:hypothetical protein
MPAIFLGVLLLLAGGNAQVFPALLFFALPIVIPCALVALFIGGTKQ